MTGVALACLLAATAAADLPAETRSAAREGYEAALGWRAELGARAAPETFCPAEWQAMEEILGELGKALEGSDGDLDQRRFDAWSGELDRRRQRCRQLARERVKPLLLEVEKKTAAAQAGLDQGLLAETESLAGLLRQSREESQRAFDGLEEDRFLDAFDTARRLLERLDGEVTDPCEDVLRLAEYKRGTEQPEAARVLYRRIREIPCLDPYYDRVARRGLEHLGGGGGDREPGLGAARAAPAAALGVAAGEGPPVAAREAPPVAAEEDPPPRLEEDPPAGARRGETGGKERSRRPRSAHRRPAVALTMWQSAWGDFSRLDELATFAGRNRIREVYLNPGLAISEDNGEAALARLLPVVERIRDLGIRRVEFLYAELNHDIGGYAGFLRRYRQELGIGTLVDDSEFTDLFRHRFEENQRTVKSYGLEYAAFITLETVGNSGVSDQTRFWALENLDHPILMSYFGCSLEEQRQWLEPYLRHAEEAGRREAVSVAILMGTKKVGREISCERALDEGSLQRFLAELDAWARRYRSYRGLVLENNRPLPGYDVAPRGGG